MACGISAGDHRRLTELYTSLTEKYDDVTRLFNAIKAGDLTNKVKTEDGQPAINQDGIEPHILFIKNIYTIFSIDSMEFQDNACVYRAAHIDWNELDLNLTGGKMVFPLPSSCTIDFEFAKRWLGNQGGGCCIFKIRIPAGVPGFIIQLLEKNSQKEIVIPAGEITISNEYIDDGYQIKEGTFSPWSYDEVLDYIANRWTFYKNRI